MSLNGIKLNSALRKNRDVHLFLHLVKAFNNQRVIFPLEKSLEKQRSSTVQYFQGSIHTQSSTRKFIKIPKSSLVFPKKNNSIQKINHRVSNPDCTVR